MGDVSEIKVSIIVPVYKVENYLTQCLDSIVHQTLREIEVLVVDEGDMDRCREIIDYYERVDPRVIGIHEHNGGYGASVNKGIERARGEYIGIVESDDWIEPTMYEELYKRAEKWRPDIVKASFAYVKNDKDLHPDDARGFLMRQLPQDLPFNIREYPYMLAAHPSIWSGIYKNEFLKKHLCVTAKGSGYVDAEFYFDNFTGAKNIIYIPDVLYHWRIDNETASCNNWKPEDFLNRWESNAEKLKRDPELLSRVGSSMASKTYVSFLRRSARYPEITSFEHVQRMSACIQLFTDEQINKAPLITPKERAELLECKHDPEGYYRRITAPLRKKAPEPPPPKPEPKPEPASLRFARKLRHLMEKVSDPELRQWLFDGFVAAALLLLCLQSGALRLPFLRGPVLAAAALFGAALACSFIGKFLNKLLKRL